eukprot:Skav227192  [mRNA]  locus=scaffold2048:173185:174543:- [translate_table: standard]
MWIDKTGTSEKRPSVALGVDASNPRKNKDREKVSPSFRIPMGGQDVEFKLNLFATSVSSNRHCVLAEFLPPWTALDGSIRRIPCWNCTRGHSGVPWCLYVPCAEQALIKQ